MRQGTIVTVPANGNAVDLAAAKRQLRIASGDNSQDVFLAELCTAAHYAIEKQLGFPVLRQTLQTHLFNFPCGPICLGAGLVTVSSVKFYDLAGTLQTFPSTDYIVDTISRPAWVHLVPDKTWPATQARPSAVYIEWTGGWATAADVPETIKQAMKLLISHWDQNREAVVIGQIPAALQMSVDWLLEAYRVSFFE